MKKCLVGLIILFAFAAFPMAVEAQDCQYHKIRFEMSTFTWIEPIEPFEACAEVPRLVGTIKGSYQECWNWSDWYPSSYLYGDPYSNVFAVTISSWIHTNKGDLELKEWLWYYEGLEFETGFALVIGGTGNFAGATGYLSYTPRFPPLGDVGYMEGNICTP